MKNRTLLRSIQFRFNVAIGIALLITLGILLTATWLNQKKWLSEIREAGNQFLDSHITTLTSQIYIYQMYKIELDPVFLTELRNIPVQTIFAIQTSDGRCLFGKCAFFNNNLINNSYIVLSRELNLADTKIGYLHLALEKRHVAVGKFDLTLIIITVIFLILLLFNQFILSKFIKKEINLPIQTLLKLFNEMETGLNHEHFKSFEDQSKVLEINSIFSNFVSMAKKSESLHLEQKKQHTQQQLYHLSTQVAHDIKSPLAALSMLESDLCALPEEKRILMRSAINRIRDIANHLLERNHIDKNPISLEKNLFSSVNEKITSHLLSGIIEGIISEKRMQFRTRIGIEIEAPLYASSYGLFANIQLLEFKRILSNIINNSIEAIDESGFVRITLESILNNRIRIQIKDNGKGIPKEILNKIGTRGVTYGKANGSGLGLYHARTTAESWGGTLGITSEIDKGTSVNIILPKANAPTWFVDKLFLFPNSIIIALDDDESIHKIWKEKAEITKTNNFGIKWLHFSTPEELKQWSYISHQHKEKLQYLIDYELIGFSENGLDLIEKLGIQNQSILVTSRYEEPKVLERCNRLKVKLIPKGMAGFIPIQVKTPQTRYDAILIDDDQLARTTWQLSAKNANYSIRTFPSPQSFFDVADEIDRSTPIYIDYCLGSDEFDNEIRGEEVSSLVAGMNFRNIYLATGLPEESITPKTWLSGIVGKEPPFTLIRN